MRARTWGVSIVASGVVLVGAWQLGRGGSASTGAAAASPPSSAAAGATEPAAGEASASSSTSRASTSMPAPKQRSTGPTGTFAGTTAQTRYGPVQVAVVARAGRITDVKALQLTNDGGRSVEISAQAAPILRHEALQAQSARIDAVSGATYTSDGYRTSLQSALDRAGL